MDKVLVIGSINIDNTLYVDSFPSEGETISAKKLEVDAGGKGLNQAIALKKAGADVLFVSALNKRETNSKVILDAVKKYDVNATFLDSDKPNGSAYILVNSLGQNKITIYPGSNDDVDPSKISKESICDAKYIVLQNEIVMGFNEYLFQNYKDKIIVYNPSPLKVLKEEYYSSISYLVVNEHEITFFSKKDNFDEMAKEILSKGVKNVVLTLGENGSVLYSTGEIIRVPALKVDAVDTVAAGDTYLGYFVAMLASGKNIKEAMEIASIASSITVARKGAASSIPYIEEIKR